MRRTLFKSKIHRATVTHANLEYEGSVTIDEDLLLAAGLWEYEARAFKPTVVDGNAVEVAGPLRRVTA